MGNFIDSDLIYDLKRQAKNILNKNIYEDGEDCGYTAASGKLNLPGKDSQWLYPFQWLWDTFFICAWNTNAQQSIIDAKKFLNSQQSNGFCGHIRYNRQIINNGSYFPPTHIYFSDGKIPETGELISKITQPPNIGYGLYELTKKLDLNERNTRELTDLYNKAIKLHRYIYTNRVIDGCMVTIHPWEAGDDNSAKWDPIYKEIEKQTQQKGELKEIVINWLKSLGINYDRVDTEIISAEQRPVDPHYYIYLFLIYLYGQWNWDEKTIIEQSPFRVIDPMTNAILLRSNIDLIRMGKKLKILDRKTEKELNSWITQTTNGLENLWSEKHNLYLTKNLVNNSLIEVETVSGLVPLFTGIIKQDRAEKIIGKIKELEENPTINYLIPSTFPTQSEYFEPNRYWRGPVWIILNEIIAQGLILYNSKELALKIRENNLNLVINTQDEKGGFYEYFNPITGEGLGTSKQSWTAAAILEAIKYLS